MRKGLVASILIILLVLTSCTQPSDAPPTSAPVTETPASTETSTSTDEPTPVPTPMPTPTPSPSPAPITEPPATGDWIITGQQSIEDRTIVLNGDLIVKDGGSLTLKRVKLIVNCSYDGEYGIWVEPGGSIFIHDSNITSPNPQQRWHIEAGSESSQFSYEPTGVSEEESPRFTFIVDHAAFELKNSELHGCGWGEPWGDWERESGGLILKNVDNAVIEGNTFSNNFYGLILSNIDNATIKNNTFSHNDGAAISLTRLSNSTISDNIFSLNLYGIQAVEAKRNTIIDNTFSAYYEAAVWLFGGCENNVIADNIISSSASWAGIAIGATAPQVANNNSVIRNTISGGEHGLAIYHSSNNRIEGNTVIDARCGIVLGYASKNIIVNNNFSNIGWEGLDSEQNCVFRSKSAGVSEQIDHPDGVNRPP
jgi:parallel beta-helix repeat protein